MDKRIEFLDSEIVTYYKTNIFIKEVEQLIVKINIPCKYYHDNDAGAKHCIIWESPKRPLMCRVYPSNQFIDYINKQLFVNKSYIEKAKIVLSQICPAVECLTTDDILAEQRRVKEKWDLNSFKRD